MDQTQILVAVAIAILGVVGLGIKFGFGKLAGVIEKHVDNNRAEGILLRLNEYAEAVVLDLKQTTVDVLKAEGKFDADAAKKIKAEALEKLKSLIGKEGLGDALEILGFENEVLEVFLSGLLEKYVLKSK